MKLNLKVKVLVAVSMSLSSLGFAFDANSMSGGQLVSVPALSVAAVGSATKQGQIVQVSIPVTYQVSVCSTFDNSNAVAYVEKELPNAVNEEQRSYEVRSYFTKNKSLMMASAMPFSIAQNCDKKREVSQPLTLKLKMSNKVKVLATTVSIPMEKEMGRYLVLIDTQTGNVKVLPLGKMKSGELYNQLFSMI